MFVIDSTCYYTMSSTIRLYIFLGKKNINQLAEHDSEYILQHEVTVFRQAATITVNCVLIDGSACSFLRVSSFLLNSLPKKYVSLVMIWHGFFTATFKVVITFFMTEIPLSSLSTEVENTCIQGTVKRLPSRPSTCISITAMGCSKSCLIFTSRPPQETVPSVKHFRNVT